jgi:HlyD family secretion protein
MIRTKFFYIPAVFALLLFSSCKEERESYSVKRSDVVESVYSSVVVEPLEMYKVTSSISGYLDEALIEVGDTVAVGQPLFYIRDISSLNASANAKIAVDIAEKNYKGDLNMLQDLKLELNNAELKRKNDSIQFSRVKKLYDKKLATRVEFEQAELMYSSSKNAVTNLKNKIKRTDRDLKLSVEQARNNLNSSKSRSDDASIINRINGIVYDIQKEQGEFISMQEPVALIGSGNSFIIKMLIDEVDITKVKKGQKIIVSLEAYGTKTYSAVVTRIAPRMDTRTQTFEVEGVFTELPDKLYYGLTGEANIVVEQKKNVVIVPREYLIGGKRIETATGIKTVKIGTTSLSHVEILEGLNEGDVIFKPE